MMDAQRAGRAITWTHVAREIGGVTAAGLTRFSKAGGPAFRR
jgi:hypothetical protein